MRYNRFGATDLTVSEIGFGCARLGGVFQSASIAEMLRTLDEALDAGITFFDTADMYCQGESEQLLGRALQGRRDKVVLASKVGYCLPARRKLISQIKPLVKPVIQWLGIKRTLLPASASGALAQDFSPTYILQAVEGSLRRLRTGYLDLYQLHSPPRDVLASGDFLAPLERLRKEGKIRAIGISCETTDDALLCLRYPEVSALQIRLSLLDQSALERAIPEARARGVALIARECFAGGLLTKPRDALGLEAFMPDPAERAAKREEIAGYQRLADDAHRPLAEMALQFVLGVEGIAVTLAGMRTPPQLSGNLRILQAPVLTDEQTRALRMRWAAQRVP